MIDESKHRHWKPAKDLTLKDFTCPRCKHIMTIEDYEVNGNFCPFCGKKLPIKEHWFNEVEVEPDISHFEEVV